MNRIKKVYICTPLKSHKFKLSTIQKVILKENVFAFIPPTEEKNNPIQGSITDKRQIELCDELWAFGAIGRDCCWEIGYAQGLGKPVTIFADYDNEQIRNDDWMIHCAGTQIKRVECYE